MADLASRNCTACRGDDPPLSREEIEGLLPDVPEWELIERRGVPQIKRVFRFQNFAQALAFTNTVGELAEQAEHHPAILTEWGKVTVRWWTHAIRGLHMNDFIMAARVDSAVGSDRR